MSHQFLLLADVHCKWLEVHTVTSTSSLSATNTLHYIFATMDYPKWWSQTMALHLPVQSLSVSLKEMVSDISCCLHIITYQWTTVERAIQTFKQDLKKLANSGSLDTRLVRSLFAYWLTPYSSTYCSSAELLISCCPKSWLDLVRPDTAQRVRHCQQQNVQHPAQQTVRFLNWRLSISQELHSWSQMVEGSDYRSQETPLLQSKFAWWLNHLTPCGSFTAILWWYSFRSTISWHSCSFRFSCDWSTLSGSNSCQQCCLNWLNSDSTGTVPFTMNSPFTRLVCTIFLKKEKCNKLTRLVVQ